MVVKPQFKVSRKFLIILASVIIGPYLLAWSLFGLSSLVARQSLHHHYGKFVKTPSCDPGVDAHKMTDSTDIHLNYLPISSWMKPFYFYKGFAYYVNYPSKDPSPGSEIGAGSGTVTAWGHIKVDPPGDGFYGCGL